MVCHYCHSADHNINNCPTIVCRYCKEVGHPKWLCQNKNNKSKTSYSTSNIKPAYKTYDKTHDKTHDKIHDKIHDKVTKVFKDKFIDKLNNNIRQTIEKDISYYLKLKEKKWSEIIQL